MKQLTRIKTLKDFRFFQNFSWDENLSPFHKYNLIYGWNGCGKSTLCDFFHGLEAGFFDNNCKFELAFQEEAKPESIINNKNCTSLKKQIKVFHHNYIKEKHRFILLRILN